MVLPSLVWSALVACTPPEPPPPAEPVTQAPPPAPPSGLKVRQFGGGVWKVMAEWKDSSSADHNRLLGYVLGFREIDDPNHPGDKLHLPEVLVGAVPLPWDVTAGSTSVFDSNAAANTKEVCWKFQDDPNTDWTTFDAMSDEDFAKWAYTQSWPGASPGPTPEYDKKATVFVLGDGVAANCVNYTESGWYYGPPPCP